jgi:hypothetical protein
MATQNAVPRSQTTTLVIAVSLRALVDVELNVWSVFVDVVCACASGTDLDITSTATTAIDAPIPYLIALFMGSSSSEDRRPPRRAIHQGKPARTGAE